MKQLIQKINWKEVDRFFDCLANATLIVLVVGVIGYCSFKAKWEYDKAVVKEAISEMKK